MEGEAGNFAKFPTIGILERRSRKFAKLLTLNLGGCKSGSRSNNAVRQRIAKPTSEKSVEQSKRKKYYEGQMMQNSRRHRESQSHDPSGRLGILGNSIDFRNEDDNNQNW